VASAIFTVQHTSNNLFMALPTVGRCKHFLMFECYLMVSFVVAKCDIPSQME